MKTWFTTLMVFICLGQYATAGLQVAAPEFSVTEGRYEKPISVKMHCDDPEALIYYTLDGSDPDQSSQLYDGQPVLIADHVSGDSLTFNNDNSPSTETPFQTFLSATLKAVAIVDGRDDSEVVSARYVLDLVETAFDVPYADPPAEGGGKHLLDVYQPVGKTGTPVLLFIHGGAWKQGDKELYMELGNTFAGYYNMTTVIANYQLSSDPWNAVHPTHVMDVAQAFAWVVDHIAEYGGDPDQIHIMGQSAGAHLCALLSTDGSYLDTMGLSVDAIQSAILMSGAYNLYDLVAWPVNPLGLDAVDVLGYKTLCQNTFNSWEQQVLDAASPGTFINMAQPPMLIVTLKEKGEFLDMPGFVADAEQFYQQIIDLNGPQVELQHLTAGDIPQEILDVDFPGETEGHYEEIYAINTKMWNSAPARMVAEYLHVLPGAPVLNPPIDYGAVALSWEREPLSQYYQLQIATDMSFDEATLYVQCAVTDTTYEFQPESGHNYYWRVQGVNGLGDGDWSPIGDLTGQTTGIEAQPAGRPVNMSMLSVYPNPFNGVLNTHIRFMPTSSARSGEIRVFDILGRQLYMEAIPLALGQQELNWKHNLNQPSGIYYVVFQSGNERLTAKAVMIK